MAKLKLAVLISGRGSNLMALMDACADAAYPAEIVVVVSHNPDAPGLAHAAKAGLPTLALNHRDYADRAAFDAVMTEAMETAGVELVCLAGFLRLLSEDFVAHWRDRLINIHPSLLPAFKGLEVQARAIAAGARFSGCTVHYVRHEMDVGPIVVQAVVPIHHNDDADALAARILEQEHVIYPAAVKWIAEGRVRIDDERALVDGVAAPKGALINPLP
ncbi:MAG: phosphoribosylglycinamide formyltransferase [Rhodospirillaceae bacterium]